MQLFTFCSARQGKGDLYFGRDGSSKKLERIRFANGGLDLGIKVDHTDFSIIYGIAKVHDARIIRLAEIDIEPLWLNEYRLLLTEEIDASLSLEPGVIMLQAVALRENPNLIRLHEVYADRAAYESHVSSPHFIKYKAQTVGMVKSLTLLDADPIRIRA